MAETRLTQEAFDRLAAEVTELETNGREQIQARILAARELGDLRENAEYQQAKEDQGFLEGRIMELRHTLETAVVMHDAATGDVVDHGVKVTLRDEDGDEETYVFTSTHNKVEEHATISPDSMLGQALAGHKVGESVSYEAPGGKFTVEILSIEAY